LLLTTSTHICNCKMRKSGT